MTKSFQLVIDGLAWVLRSEAVRVPSARDDGTSQVWPGVLAHPLRRRRSGPELLDLVAEQGGRDRRLVRLTLDERLGELLGLLVLDLARQRRLVRRRLFA